MSDVIHLVVIRVPGTRWETTVTAGSILEEILKAHSISIDWDRESVLFEDRYLSEQEVRLQLMNSGTLIIATGAIGRAPTPKMKESVQFLRRRGFTESSAGKGDHRKFTSQSGEVILLNPDNRDRKHLDLGSSKSMAQVLHLSLAELCVKVAGDA